MSALRNLWRHITSLFSAQIRRHYFKTEEHSEAHIIADHLDAQVDETEARLAALEQRMAVRLGHDLPPRESR